MGLNEVQPRRPEQLVFWYLRVPEVTRGLNEVRPRRPEQSDGADVLRGLGLLCLNEVRPRRPEQSSDGATAATSDAPVSMKSGLEGRNNTTQAFTNHERPKAVSMKSGLEGRNNGPTDNWHYCFVCLNEVRPRRPEQLFSSST